MTDTQGLLALTFLGNPHRVTMSALSWVGEKSKRNCQCRSGYVTWQVTGLGMEEPSSPSQNRNLRSANSPGPKGN